MRFSLFENHSGVVWENFLFLRSNYLKVTQRVRGKEDKEKRSALQVCHLNFSESRKSKCYQMGGLGKEQAEIFCPVWACLSVWNYKKTNNTEDY